MENTDKVNKNIFEKIKEIVISKKFIGGVILVIILLIIAGYFLFGNKAVEEKIITEEVQTEEDLTDLKEDYLDEALQELDEIDFTIE